MISIMKGEMQANDDGNHSKGLLTTQAAHIRGGYVAAGVVATLMYCINIGEVTLMLIFVVMGTQQLSFCIVSCSFYTLNFALTSFTHCGCCACESEESCDHRGTTMLISDRASECLGHLH